METARYAVFSFNSDQQEPYCDYVTADSYEQAVESVMNSRPDVRGADAYTAADLWAIADDLDEPN